jgi:hypothetical protein
VITAGAIVLLACLAWILYGEATPMLYGVGLAIVLVFFLKETGPAVRRTVP